MTIACWIIYFIGFPSSLKNSTELITTFSERGCRGFRVLRHFGQILDFDNLYYLDDLDVLEDFNDWDDWDILENSDNLGDLEDFDDLKL